MESNDLLRKTILYIAIQLAALWSIFMQLTAQNGEGRLEVFGLLILTAVLLFYARKTIRMLNRSEEERKENFQRG